MAINSKSLISFAGAAFAFVGVGSGFAAELIVEDGATVTATESATYESSDIRGKYTVSAGLTVKATANALGSTQSTAELVVDGTGAVFGENSTASYNMTIGTGGGKGKIICRNGGSFRCGLFTLASDSLVDEDGYADVLDVEETATIYGREFYNKNASATARIRIKGGTVTFDTTGDWYNTKFKSGAWVVDVADGAVVRFHNAYRPDIFNASDVAVKFTGAGAVQFLGNDQSVAVNNGVEFLNSGWVENVSSSAATFANGVVFGEDVAGLSIGASKKVTVNGVVNLNAIKGGSSSVLTGSGSITMGAGDRAVSITGPVGTAETTVIPFVKTGAGDLTISDTTPYLASLDVQAGRVLVKGAFSAGALKVAEGAQVLADGGALTLEGGALEMSGGSIGFANFGLVVLRVGADSMPTITGPAALTVSEYWIDGVKQGRGEYTLGTATVRVVPPYSDDDLTIWTNDDPERTDWQFAAGSQYLGFVLRSPAVSLNLTGATTLIGSSGIAVDPSVTAESHYDFRLPIEVGTSEAWDFGPASVSFSGPLSAYEGATAVPTVKIASENEVGLYATNSTYAGNLTVTGNIIRVSGDDALGAAGGVTTLRILRSATHDDARCWFEGGTFNRTLSLSCPTYNNNNYTLYFAAGTTNEFKGNIGTLPQWTRLEKGVRVAFLGGVGQSEYSRIYMAGNAELYFGGKLTLGGYSGSRCITLNMEPSMTGNRVFLDCEVDYKNEGAPDGFNVQIGFTDWYALRDYVFTRGWTEISSRFHLNGHPQRMTKVTGDGTVSSTNAAANIELDYAATDTFTNSVKFVDLAGVRMVGAGTAVLKGESSTEGAFAVENGTVELVGSWPNATKLTVTGDGCLKLTKAKQFGKQVELHLGGSGRLEIPEGVVLKVAALYLPDPDDPSVEKLMPVGPYSSTETGGRIVGGSVFAGKAGMIVIVW